MIVIQLTDVIDTSFSGYKKLINFYHDCSDYTNETISIDFYKLDWIDGNQSALLEAILYRLSKENRLTFSTDLDFLSRKFDVLFRNGFIYTGVAIEDDRKSTVPVKGFDCGDKNGFVHYISEKLMQHRGMPDLNPQVRSQIIDDLIEIFCNTHLHANTSDPFFVAGQYYPRIGELRFTMVDLGDGFLPRIKKATQGSISSSIEAINWAISGNSSKLSLDQTSGGLGLKNINRYCNENNGVLDIVTGDGYWSSSYRNTIFPTGRKIERPFIGTTINLTFQSS